jgi:hypothetical protein
MGVSVQRTPKSVSKGFDLALQQNVKQCVQYAVQVEQSMHRYVYCSMLSSCVTAARAPLVKHVAMSNIHRCTHSGSIRFCARVLAPPSRITSMLACLVSVLLLILQPNLGCMACNREICTYLGKESAKCTALGIKRVQ